MRRWARDSLCWGIAGTLVQEPEKIKDGVGFQTADDGTGIATHLFRVMGARGSVNRE
jgi:hypothetical protein